MSDIDYAKGILDGLPGAMARVMSWLENEDPRSLPVMQQIYPHTGKAYIIGITGSPGAGKSTLTDKIAQHYRKQNLTVGIIALDPTSPFTGGAILGDRIRMSDLSLDPGVFIRSMATRGFMGGLSKYTSDVIKVMDASGKDIIIVETVGVGQDEVDVMNIADTTCVVCVPGLGDIIQSMKAGVMEIADVFIINKSDRPGADQIHSEIEYLVAITTDIKKREWEPPIVKTVAVNDEGIGDLLNAISRHREQIEKDESLTEKRKKRIRQETLQVIHYELFRLLQEHILKDNRLEKIVEAIMNNSETPYSIMQKIVDDYIKLKE
jgi:LAO/AO transport system kinase